MSLTATQRAILRAAQTDSLYWNPITGDYSIGEGLHSWVTPEGLSKLVRAGYLTTTYTLTPAGAEAAREGTE